MANLNRIKHLEQQVAEQRDLIEQLEGQNDAAKEAAEDAAALREIVHEREAQLLSLSRRLELSENRERNEMHGEAGRPREPPAGKARDSAWLERMGFSSPANKTPFGSLI